MNRKRLLVLLLTTLGLLASGAVWATNIHIVWTPTTLAPASIIPGDDTTYTVSFRNTGPSSIETEHLRVLVSGDASAIVTLETPKFPKVIKKGGTGTIVLQVHTASGTPVSVVSGTLQLVRKDDDEKEAGKEDDRKAAKGITPVLPIELTISPFALPPNPGPENDTTILGIDTDENGVRDDIDRYIGFTYPDSARKRAALTQYAQAEQLFLRDAGDKAKSREHALNGLDPAQNCAWVVFDPTADVGHPMAESVLDNLDVRMQNTKARVRAYSQADFQLGGMVGQNDSSDCSFQSNILPN